jgi:hypothetical protein
VTRGQVAPADREHPRAVVARVDVGLHREGRSRSVPPTC